MPGGGDAAAGAAEPGERYWELEARRRQIAAREAFALQGLAAQWGLTNRGDVPMPASRPPMSFLSVPIVRNAFPGGFGMVDGESAARNCLYGKEYVPLPIPRVRTGR